MMMRIKTLIILFLFAANIAGAYSESDDTIIIKYDDDSENISIDLDSLVNDWYVKSP